MLNYRLNRIAMSLYFRSCQAIKSARATATSLSPLSSYQRRYAWFWDRFKKRSQESSAQTVTPNPLTEEYLTRKPSPPKLVQGGLAESSILEDEEVAGPKPKAIESKDGQVESLVRNPLSMAAVLDPAPEARKRWERKMVIRDIRKRGRLTKAQQIKRSEREIVSKSHDFKTSVKKLVHLANQIKGKSLEDAIIQMRFSKKKVAKDVKEHLEHSKNEAIVRRGMGLGFSARNRFTPITIMTNDKKRVKVTDPTTIYVDQAWCGKGLYEKTPDYRARGRMNIMRNPTTSITVVLKEEATRIRIHKERETREAKKKTWVQLPNRPITSQRQYYSW
ncbi:54S ribosomal protein L22, mitochondrial [Golovinomyces cichoracearum]|uniref:54S ribosomal protein L22, mitochondrial n=1 Tax=Golovinomyces cichoracearum TaxID=62708 RepID=A0A420J951_9PEZI|nr:54S ribosomal protein L22, mitochondrial [Golovinomyces cichoracearum]